MEPEYLEKLKLLYNGIKQLNQRLLVNYLLLSIATASLLAGVIDFFWDLRIIVFFIWIFFLSYVAYKLIFEIKFSSIKKRLDVSQKIEGGHEEEIKEGFILLRLGNYKVRLNFKDCSYYLTDDFVFAFQAFKILAIFIIDKSKPKTVIEDFISKFKKQRNLKYITAFAILIILLTITWKLSLEQLNHKLLSDDSVYKVQKIVIGDSTLYESSNSEFVMLTTNFLNDVCPESKVVKFHCRFEHFEKIRMIYNVFINTSSKTEQAFKKDKLLGYYSYQINKNEITLVKDDIRFTIEKIPKINPAPNQGYNK